MQEEDTSEYWDKKWAYGEHRRERVILDGSDGEREFDKELRLRTAEKTVLDEGCGNAAFTLRIAAKAKQVKGIDISTTALRQAETRLVRSGLANVGFSLEDAGKLSFRKNTFDVVYSRRGPGSDSTQTLSEAYRVLRNNGIFMEITIGERDKQNLARIFGRGQMFGLKRQVSMMKQEMLEKVGFVKVVTRDYLGTEVFRAMSDLMVRLRSAPIIPAFDPRRDRRFLKRVQRECLTDRGIETPVHRVVLIGYK